MKRRELLRHLEKYGCYLLREGGRHSMYLNPNYQRISSIPRHTEIKNFLAQKTCKDLGVPMLRHKK
jgi:predicted RNA binding protein YcfA (HicA-like mRNA interferase family)